jgi:hypothetical protein
VHSKLLKIALPLAAIAAFAATAATGSIAVTPQPGNWSGPTSQGSGQQVFFTVNSGTPETVDPISFGAFLSCPSGKTISVGHGFGGFQTPIDPNTGQFELIFGPAQGSVFTYTDFKGTFTSATKSHGVLHENWAALKTPTSAEVCKSGAVKWTATPSSPQGKLDLSRYDHYWMTTKHADGSITTQKLK